MDRTAHQNNGRMHVIGLGHAAALAQDLRRALDTAVDVAWAADIYAAAAHYAQQRQAYRALLLDLRWLAWPLVEQALALGRRTGLPVWVLPGDGARQKAALSAGALAWSPALDWAERGAAPKDVAPPVDTRRFPADAKDTKSPGLPPRSDRTARAPMPERRPSLPPTLPPAPDDTDYCDVSVPARVAAPARTTVAAALTPATSENTQTAKNPQKRVTFAPPAEYDEEPLVLTEEELRALLGPPG